MTRSFDSRRLRIPVTNLQKKVFSRERVCARLDVSVGEHGLTEGGGLGDLEIEVWLESSPDGIRVRGRITGCASMQCTRCLGAYSQEIDTGVDEFYRRRGLGAVSGDGRPLPERDVSEEDEYMIVEGTIDLNLLVNDTVMLDLPMKRLCHEGCRGLCQSCGADLNDRECGCGRESIDPRLEVLRALLERDDA